MNLLRTTLTALLAGALTITTATEVFAQGLIPRVEGSRPGQTYIEGQPAPQQPAAQQPAYPAAQQQPYAGQSTSQQQPVPQQQPYAGQPTAQQPLQPGQATQVPRQVPGQPAATLPAPPRTASGVTPVILEFSDLQCPDSARYNTGLKSTIMQRYIASGRAEYQWHDFPLPSHNKAIDAAAAARCAGSAADQVRQKIMAHQGDMNPARWVQFAQEAGVNPQQFSDCMRSGQHRDAVLRDKALGESFGVKNTTSLVLGVRQNNGQISAMKVIKGYDPPQQVLGEIDQWLAQLNSQTPQQGQARQ